MSKYACTVEDCEEGEYECAVCGHRLCTHCARVIDNDRVAHPNCLAELGAVE